MPKQRIKRCPECGFLDVIKWGSRNGHQRYKCKNCNTLFSNKRKDISASNRFIWFERWILGKQTIRQLSDCSGYGEKTLRRWFDSYLRNYPNWEVSRREKVNLLIDGTYFANKVCLVLYRDQRIKATLFYRLSDGEWEEEIREDLENIQSVGIEIESVTCDGLYNIIKSVRKSSPNTIIQRCIIHIQRECLIWLTKRPQSIAGVELRKIVQVIHTIKDREQWGYWVVSLIRWEEKHREFLNEKSYKEDTKRYWYTHKLLRRAFIHIKRALPDMFHYLDNPNIPSNTNALESFFGHLKQNISLHRGLSKEHFRNYVKWYLYFRNKDNKRTKK